MLEGGEVLTGGLDAWATVSRKSGPALRATVWSSGRRATSGSTCLAAAAGARRASLRTCGGACGLWDGGEGEGGRESERVRRWLSEAVCGGWDAGRRVPRALCRVCVR